MVGLSYICPYCFTEHKISSVQFRCKNKRCKMVSDKELAKYNGAIPELRQICFHAQKEKAFTMPSRENCPECKEESTTRVCPSCHNNLPSAIETNRDMIISIVGARDSGKSSYVAVLIRELKKRIALGFNGAANFMDKDSIEQYDERFGRYIYPTKSGEVPRRLPQTQSSYRGNAVIGANRPILCDFTIEKKKLLKKQRIPYTFVFFDAAGEDFDDEDVMFTISKYICRSKGIIFLLDPLHIAAVRGALPNEIVKGASTVELGSVSAANEIILRVANLIRSKNRINDKDKIKIPVAATFSKLDAIQSILPSNTALMKESPHVKNGKFVEQDALSVEQEMLGLLNEWDEQEFLSYLSINYENYSLFAFSAFGNNPDVSGKIEPPRPHRIEDALLWILKELKTIDSMK